MNFLGGAVLYRVRVDGSDGRMLAQAPNRATESPMERGTRVRLSRTASDIVVLQD